jgi:hypothetical protein
MYGCVETKFQAFLYLETGWRYLNLATMPRYPWEIAYGAHWVDPTTCLDAALANIKVTVGNRTPDVQPVATYITG